MRALDIRRHEIGDNGNAAGRLERGFENQRMAAIRAPHFSARIGGCDRPSPVVRGAEEIGETGGRIEARPAKPIDGQVAPDEGGRLAIPDDRIVFDVQGHAPASGVKIRAKTYLNTSTLILGEPTKWASRRMRRAASEAPSCFECNFPDEGIRSGSKLF